MENLQTGSNLTCREKTIQTLKTEMEYRVFIRFYVFSLKISE